MSPTSRPWRSRFNKIRTREYTGRGMNRRYRAASVFQRTYRHSGSTLRREIARRIKRKREADAQLLADYRTVIAAYGTGVTPPYNIDPAYWGQISPYE